MAPRPRFSCSAQLAEIYDDVTRHNARHNFDMLSRLLLERYGCQMRVRTSVYASRRMYSAPSLLCMPAKLFMRDMGMGMGPES
jgi:hypothetical protein